MGRPVIKAMLALAIWATGASLCELVAAEPLTAEPTTKWVAERKVGRFHIHSDFQLADDEPLMGELDQISGEVSRMLAIPTATQTIHVVLFSSAKEYSRYIKNYFPTVPERRALFIQHRGPGMLFAHWHTDIRTDIRHEVVHGLLNDQSGPLPLWLDEGLAEYFEVTEDARMAGNPHLASVVNGIQRDYVPQLVELEQVTSIDQLAGEQYRDSWAWVHFLLHRSPQTRQILVKYLASVRSKQITNPLSRVVATELPNWRVEFTEHFKALASNNSGPQ